MPLTTDMLIRAADDLTITVKEGNLVVQAGGAPVLLSDFSLTVLDTFRTPVTFAGGVKRLEALAAKPNDWMMMTREVNRLLQVGALVSETPRIIAASVERVPTPIEIKLHLDLLRDTVRTQVYLDALHAAVKPTDIVVDIGSGNGILAMGAAHAGAKHVYAIEASPVASTTRKIFEANGFADRITLIEGWSMTVDLPEKADLVVSELLSNDVFTENLLQVARDAERRLLKPSGRIIPEAARIWGRLVQLPEALRGRRTIAKSDVADWQGRYGLDFSRLYESQWHGQTQTEVNPMHLNDEWRLLSDPTQIGAVRLDHIESLSYSTSAEVVCTGAGRLDGLLLHFDLDVIPGHSMTTDPLAEVRATSWLNPVWFCEPLEATPGDRFRVTLKHQHRHPLSVEVSIERV